MTDKKRGRPTTSGPTKTIAAADDTAAMVGATVVPGEHDRVIPRQRVAVPGEQTSARRRHQLGCERRRLRISRALDALLGMDTLTPKANITEIDYHACGLDLGWSERRAAAPPSAARRWPA